MRASDYRAAARQNLQGKWKNALLLTLICMSVLIVFYSASALYIMLSGVSYDPTNPASLMAYYTSQEFRISNMLISIGSILTVCLGISQNWIYLCVANNVNPEFNSFVATFKRAWESFVLHFILGIKIILWTLLLVIPGIIKAFAYSMAIFIKIENPSISSNEAIVKSNEMMKGNKWRLFCLYVSFIGWYLLTGIVGGMIGFWVDQRIGIVVSTLVAIPLTVYVSTSTAIFYKNLKGEISGVQEVNNVSAPDSQADTSVNEE